MAYPTVMMIALYNSDNNNCWLTKLSDGVIIKTCDFPIVNPNRADTFVYSVSLLAVCGWFLLLFPRFGRLISVVDEKVSLFLLLQACNGLSRKVKSSPKWEVFLADSPWSEKIMTFSSF